MSRNNQWSPPQTPHRHPDKHLQPTYAPESHKNTSRPSSCTESQRKNHCPIEQHPIDVRIDPIQQTFNLLPVQTTSSLDPWHQPPSVPTAVVPPAVDAVTTPSLVAATCAVQSVGPVRVSKWDGAPGAAKENTMCFLLGRYDMDGPAHMDGTRNMAVRQESALQC